MSLKVEIHPDYREKFNLKNNGKEGPHQVLEGECKVFVVLSDKFELSPFGVVVCWAFTNDTVVGEYNYYLTDDPENILFSGKINSDDSETLNSSPPIIIRHVK